MLSLNPLWRMRNEGNKILLYKLDSPEGVIVEEFCPIHPLHAIILSMFDGCREEDEIRNDFCYITNLSRKIGSATFSELLNELNSIAGDILISTTKRNKCQSIYRPEDFVIPNDNIKIDNNPRLDRPLQLGFDVTNKCDRNCIYCYAETGFSEIEELLSLDRIKEVLDEAKKIGIVGVPFGGGDPLAREDMPQILKHCNSIRLNYMISTKKYLSSEYCSQLRDSGVKKIQVSIDSVDPEIADIMTGSIGFLPQIFDTISNLQNAGICVSCKAVVTSLNIAGVLDLCHKLVHIGIRTIKLVGYGRSIYRHSDELFASKNEIIELQERIEMLKEADSNIDVSFGGIDTELTFQTETFDKRREIYMNRNICIAGKQSMHILPDGRVSLCEQLPAKDDFVIGDLKDQSLEEIWNSEKLQKWLSPNDDLFKGTLCENCPDLLDCNTGRGRCFRNSYSIYGSPWAPVPNCPYADEFFRMS